MSKNKIGRFMLAAGAIIEHPTEQKILVAKRAITGHQDHQWELLYGRIDNHEEVVDGLKREIFEETGLKNIKVVKALRVWHIYRGEKLPDLEIFGMTFVCKTGSDKITLCKEHSEYSWVTPQEALELIQVEGIVVDIELYIKYLKTPNSFPIAVSDINNDLSFY